MASVMPNAIKQGRNTLKLHENTYFYVKSGLKSLF